MGIPISRTVAELRSIVAVWRRDGLKVAVVPTMALSTRAISAWCVPPWRRPIG